jgi:hypothetical protein
MVSQVALIFSIDSFLKDSFSIVKIYIPNRGTLSWEYNRVSSPVSASELGTVKTVMVVSLLSPKSRSHRNLSPKSQSHRNEDQLWRPTSSLDWERTILDGAFAEVYRPAKSPRIPWSRIKAAPALAIVTIQKWLGRVKWLNRPSRNPEARALNSKVSLPRRPVTRPWFQDAEEDVLSNSSVLAHVAVQTLECLKSYLQFVTLFFISFCSSWLIQEIVSWFCRRGQPGANNWCVEESNDVRDAGVNYYQHHSRRVRLCEARVIKCFFLVKKW